MLSTPAGIEAVIEPVYSEVVALHEGSFPGTNTTEVHLLRLVGSRPDSLEERCEGDVVGDVVTELQNDESLCIDDLGVSDVSCGQGTSRALVGAAVQVRADETALAYLLVRASNTADRGAVRLCRPR